LTKVIKNHRAPATAAAVSLKAEVAEVPEVGQLQKQKLN
jgi:hypothetical protein